MGALACRFCLGLWNDSWTESENVRDVCCVWRWASDLVLSLPLDCRLCVGWRSSDCVLANDSRFSSGDDASSPESVSETSSASLSCVHRLVKRRILSPSSREGCPPFSGKTVRMRETSTLNNAHHSGREDGRETSFILSR